MHRAAMTGVQHTHSAESVHWRSYLLSLFCGRRRYRRSRGRWRAARSPAAHRGWRQASRARLAGCARRTCTVERSKARRTRRLWRRRARAPEAVDGVLVAGPRPGSAEPPRTAGRTPRRRRSRAVALPSGKGGTLTLLPCLPSSPATRSLCASAAWALQKRASRTSSMRSK